MRNGWQFWIDRGGTFTDVVSMSPEGQLRVDKLLSENPEQYDDAAIEAIRRVLDVPEGASIPSDLIDSVRMGTTVATNALLEHKGEPTVLFTTKGFADAVRIGYQNRPNIFALNIVLPRMLYEQVVEIEERMGADGEVLAPLNASAAEIDVQSAREAGFRSCAIALMHGYKFQEHEQRLAEIARAAGFENVSTSHESAPLIKFVSRADTTLVDAYLSPILRRYVDKVSSNLGGSKLFFMQSNGGLAEANHFRGKDSILSGPAGGIVGAVKTAALHGEDRLITFDMGGTSTDVAHYAGEFEREYETQIAGARVRAPMLSIHTVAAGGGSICSFDGSRFRVGPDSAGANPGPACYRNGGPLTVTDCNVVLGRIQPEHFPKVFGSNHNQAIDVEAAKERLREIASRLHDELGAERDIAEIAFGFLRIAVEKMANAIKQVSTQKGHDPEGYVLQCFGGAGGQHACMIADSLGIKRIFIHPLAGVLSALGIGLSDVSVIKDVGVEQSFESVEQQTTHAERAEEAKAAALSEFAKQVDAPHETIVTAYVRYRGSDFSIPTPYAPLNKMQATFVELHKQRYGYAPPIESSKDLILEKLSVEVRSRAATPDLQIVATESCSAAAHASAFFDGAFQNVPLLAPAALRTEPINGPCILYSDTATTVVEPGWRAEKRSDGTLVLSRFDHRSPSSEARHARGIDQPTDADPILLEVFNNLFMFIAEQMGVTLQNTSHSVNIKERLDFSCALFDNEGNLVPNAPHIPVHLGSMGESVQQLIAQVGDKLKPGDVYALNDPYNGGTHLPDVTVISAYFNEGSPRPSFFVASRGHHADIGGITPGSMPPFSKNIDEEGVRLNMVQIVSQGKFLDEPIRSLLSSATHPARNIEQNLADLSAQIAANQKGLDEIKRMSAHYGQATVDAYMRFVQDNAEESVRRVIDKLSDGAMVNVMDNGATIKASIKVEKSTRTATIDFSGTSKQLQDNYNAPSSVCKAAVLYVFRTLVNDEIPLNAGCMKPLRLIIPEGSMLNPQYPAAVVAGNVETSQVIVDVLYGALGVLSASQGTMNNFTFGNEKYQYYETIAGGSGAGTTFDGADAVQTHMTNSRLTDPEVLETRFPVLLEEFKIRTASGGAGAHHGGNGTVRKIKFLKPMTASILSNRRAIAPFGLKGGKHAKPGANYVLRSNGEVDCLAASATEELNAGDTFVIETPGGGGYGAPG